METKQPHTKKSQKIWLCHRKWLTFSWSSKGDNQGSVIYLFYFYSMVRYRLFLKFFCWWTPWLGYFIGYSFRISRKHQPFPMAQPTNRINQLWNLPTKKLEKSHMFTICGNETATSYDRANNIRKMDVPHGGSVCVWLAASTDATFSRIKKLCQGIGYMVVSSPQRDEDTAFLSRFPLGGIHG